MGLISCPDCGRPVSDLAAACVQCGRPVAAMAPRPSGGHDAAAPSQAAPPASTRSLAERWRANAGRTVHDQPAVTRIAEEHLFFPVAVHKFVVLSICTLGFYELYWAYRNWQRIKAREREDLSPFWRAFFAGIWNFGLFDRIQDEGHRRHVPVLWSPVPLALAFLVLGALYRLPDPWWWISLGMFVPMIPVVRTTRAINATQPAAERENDRYSLGDIAVISLGSVILLLALVGSFAPP